MKSERKNMKVVASSVFIAAFVAFLLYLPTPVASENPVGTGVAVGAGVQPEKSSGEGFSVNPTSYVLRRLNEYRDGIDKLVRWYEQHCGRSPAQPLEPLEEAKKEPPKWVPYEYELVQVQTQSGNNPFFPSSPLSTSAGTSAGGTTTGGTGFVGFFQPVPGVQEAMLQLLPTPGLISGSNNNPGLLWTTGADSGVPAGFVEGVPIGGATWSNGGNMSENFPMSSTTVNTRQVKAGGSTFTVQFKTQSTGIAVTGLVKQ